MDEFKPEDDLRPDSSDRRPSRARRASGPRLAVSRQHMMIGIGILVLVLLIISIGSALKAPTQHEVAQRGGARDINLSGSSSLNASNNGAAGGTTAANDNSGQPSAPQTISVPPIAGTPTEAQPLPPPGGAQQRVELPGNISDVLSSPQGAAGQQINVSTSGLPTAPATLMRGAATREATRPAYNTTTTATAQPHKAPAKTAASKTAASKPAAASRPAATTTRVYTPPAAGKSSGTGSLKTTSAGRYTLQLSGASRSDTLNAFAKQQNLQHFKVYQTRRDGKPWYVLVSGNYASPEEARRAIATLPAEIQAKKPWVRPLQQVE